MADVNTMNLFGQMINDVVHDFSRPASAWQLGVLLFCLGLAWILSKRLIHLLSKRPTERSLTVSYAANSLKKVAFPLMTWLFVWIAKWILSGYMKPYVLNLALAPLFGVSLLYFGFFMVRRVLGVSASAIGMIKIIEKILTTLVWLVVLLYVLGALDDVTLWMDKIVFTIGSKQKISLLTLLNGIAWVFLTIVVALFVSSILSERIMRSTALEANLKELSARLIRVSFVTLALIVSLSSVGIDLTALSLFGGALGVALGFGLQKVASNYVSGFIILLERSLRLGDFISVDKYTGTVTQIRTRYTVLHAPDDTEILVPNELMMANMVRNFSHSHNLVRLAVQVQASYQAEPEKVLGIINEAVKGVPRVLTDPAPAAVLVSFADSGILYELGFWINDPERGRLGVQSDVNLAIWRAFQEHGIAIPYPQRELRVLSSNSFVGSRENAIN